MSRTDAFWMGLSCLIVGYVLGSARESYLTKQDLRWATEARAECQESQEHAEWQRLLAEVK